MIILVPMKERDLSSGFSITFTFLRFLLNKLFG